ncbi:MAG: LarC family nickel insertion protein, partial [Chloroflexi bacterium]|nr:LarC family nickel insertion protein [Chloroflexota bacterium]
MRSAYFNLIGGVSGDMLLGALVDVGLPVADIEAELSRLGIGGYRLRAEKSTRGAVSGTCLTVELDEDGRRRRKWSEFIDVIAAASLEASVRSQATAVFQALTAAESRVHGNDHATAGPHELGTVDTLVDVVGVVAGLKRLGIERVYSSAVPAGAGMVRSEHGVLPVPAPATLQILTAAHVPVRVPGPLGPDGEASTPTGAAIVASLASFSAVQFTVEKTGYGLGTRNPAHYPNVVGLWLGTVAGPVQGGLKPAGGLALLETNIDD